jgi:hypothetical protein
MSDIMSKVGGKVVGGVAIGIAVVVLLFSTMGINDNGYRTVVQLPTGTTFVKFTPGIYFPLMGTTTVYPDVVTTGVNEGITIRYQDGGTGSVDGTVRVSLPTAEDSMLTLHRAVRSEAGLREKLLLPEIKQALNLTSGLMTSEEAYAVKRNDYAFYAEDQLANGKYITELVAKTVTTSEGKSQTVQVPQIALDKEGTKLHHGSPFAEYSLKVVGFQITEWNFENDTLTQIREKRSAEMAIITAKANANKAVWEQKQIKADGEKEVERVRYQELQIAEKATIVAQRVQDVAVIGAQKEVLVNEEAEKAAVVDVRTAIAEAKATKTRADAEAYAKKAVILADGALTQKLATYVKAQSVWADAYAKRAVPQFVMGGGSSDVNNDASMFQSMLQAMMAKDLVLDTSVTK